MPAYPYYVTTQQDAALMDRTCPVLLERWRAAKARRQASANLDEKMERFKPLSRVFHELQSAFAAAKQIQQAA